MYNFTKITLKWGGGGLLIVFKTITSSNFSLIVAILRARSHDNIVLGYVILFQGGICPFDSLTKVARCAEDTYWKTPVS